MASCVLYLASVLGAKGSRKRELRSYHLGYVQTDGMIGFRGAEWEVTFSLSGG